MQRQGGEGVRAPEMFGRKFTNRQKKVGGGLPNYSGFRISS